MPAALPTETLTLFSLTSCQPVTFQAEGHTHGTRQYRHATPAGHNKPGSERSAMARSLREPDFWRGAIF